MNEQIKKLFISVEDGLPKESGNYVVLILGKDISTSWYLVTRNHFQVGSIVTHWLDLSTLTTKEAAIELAKDAFKAGRNWEYDNHFGEVPSPEPNEETFISQNENRL